MSSSGSNGHVEKRYTQNRLFSNSSPSLDELKEICTKTTTASEYAHASSIISKIPLYTASSIDISDEAVNASVQDEWYRILHSGPGVFVVKGMYREASVVNAANTAFHSIIASEKSLTKGDHFGSAGKNERIWNALEKHCLKDPVSFAAYYQNPWLAAVSSAWLGPAYKVTSQVNIVKPGGAAQSSHRDYHLGFQSAQSVAKFPAAMHVASQFLTLQGAVAHSDMPLNSGPTRFLPYSQTYEPGFMAFRLPEFTEYFLQEYVSVALELGDGVFFNPALFHAAGENTTSDFDRSANLLQISSAFGKPMESIDSIALVESTWEALHVKYQKEGLSAEVRSLIAVVAEGYPFPTDLDRRPPTSGGLAPESEQDVLYRCLAESRDVDHVVKELKNIRRFVAV